MPVIYSKKRSGGMEICDMADSANDIIDEDLLMCDKEVIEV